jgi:hypothetical protein
MKNKKEIKEEVDNQTEIDKQEILRLHKIISPTSGDMNSIYELYKKYVDTTARAYNTNGCNTCGNSIVNYWRGLLNWFNVNRNIFE